MSTTSSTLRKRMVPTKDEVTLSNYQAFETVSELSCKKAHMPPPSFFEIFFGAKHHTEFYNEIELDLSVSYY